MALNKLTGLRVGYGDSQTVLANYLGIAPNTYSKKETGKQHFLDWEIKKIAEKYSLSPDEVWAIFFD